MDKKVNSEELQSRREFFKKAAKSALPIIGVVAMLSVPVIANASKQYPQSCQYDCTYSCRGGCAGCTGGCQGGCQGRCYGSCSSSCGATCLNACTYQVR